MRYSQDKKYKQENGSSQHNSLCSSQYKLCRFILLNAITASLISGIIDNPLASMATLGLAGTLFIYSMISYSLYYNTRKTKILHTLIGIDGILSALALSEWGYNPWLSLLLLALFYFIALYHGGIKRWVITNLGFISGALLAYFVVGNTTFTLDSHIVVNILLLLGTLLVLGLYGVCHRKHTQSVEEEFDRISDEIKQQKLRLYEISRFLPKSAWDQIEGKQKPKITRKPITIFFSDIVGFSSLSEELEAETLANVLSSYLAEMSDIVAQYNGTIDKFIGDAIMVTFGDDDNASKGTKADAIACVSMAIAMGKRMRELQTTWSEMGIKKPLQIRIGINSGYCTVGTFGTSKHLDHTALGVHVNLASRLESAGQPEEILVSHETWSLIKDTILCKDKGKIKAKGFSHPVQVYQVINHRKELGSQQSYYSQTTEGFSIHLDMEKIKNYDRDKVISSLEAAAQKLKEKQPRK
jgi:adenylate cyclase